MEDQVYDGIDDYLRYVRRWVRRYDTPLTANSIKEYGSAVWNQWLARRYGRSIVRQAWARAIHAKPGGFSVAAYDAAIRAAGGSDFSRDFARFAATCAEWRTGAVFREGDALSRRLRARAACRSDGRALTAALNHTTFQLLRVHARGGRAVVVSAIAPRGVAAGLALVGRIGSERRGARRHPPRFKPRAAGACRCAWPGPAASTASPRCWSTPTPARSGFSARRLDWPT